MHTVLPELTVIENQDKERQIMDYAKLNQEFLKNREKKKLDYLKVDSILIKWQSEIDSKRKKVEKMIHHLHQESSDFLVTNFDLIIIPEFGKQESYKKRDSGKGLSKSLKTVMSHLSHCRFRDTLIRKYSCPNCYPAIMYSQS